MRERAANGQASASLERLQTLEDAQLKMMQIRQSLQDYLLSGCAEELEIERELGELEAKMAGARYF